MSLDRVGAVVIGRNEGDRLVRCLASLGDVPVVYVDSGSSDESVEHARSVGCEIVELDTATSFTAARARNAGLDRLRQVRPDIALVQFVDGDCEIVSGWLESAVRTLERESDVAVVCGRRRERHPEHSVFNRLCDLEWDTPVGRTEACGGDAMMRVEALVAAGGYDPALIAGEEPELCFRLRRQGWLIERLDVEMTLHDAAMTSIEQWYRRTMRSGHAFAEQAWMHGAAPEHIGVRPTLSNLFWGGALPVGILAGSLVTRWAWLGLGLYAVLGARVYRSERRRGRSRRDAVLYGSACVAGKVPECAGALKLGLTRLRGGRSTLIEYKRPARVEAA